MWGGGFLVMPDSAMKPQDVAFNIRPISRNDGLLLYCIFAFPVPAIRLEK